MPFLLGLSAGLTPFCNHDHARRALYQSQKHSYQKQHASKNLSPNHLDNLKQLLVTDSLSLYGYEGQARGDEGDTSVSHDYWDNSTWDSFRVLASQPDVRTCLGLNGYADSAVDRLWQKKNVEIIFVIY
ncbi:hypothetical protein POM88_047596 [Heracleum sosnowskyi]|uniref:DNA-directed RNA polymerase n=1 Tax=Heracleum sosnowskyi TaxID=360622 RepID=A0AAD8GUG9_9APIA|nr:hypothetical protein POM88_047596 [Heracleum sosnowskyi]